MSFSYPAPYLLIGERRIGASERATRPVADPATGETIGELPIATEADIAEAAAAAQRAFAGWRRRSSHQRQAILREGARLLRARREEAAWAITTEEGKPLAEARIEVDIGVETLEWYADEGRRLYGRIIPSRLDGHRQYVEIEPVGPVAAFAPWNFPLVNSLRKIAPALAAGCTVVAKPAEETPAATLIAAECLIAAGLPAGVLGVIFGEPAQISSRLIASPDIRKISFTGSVVVGKQLAALAAQHGKRSTMELGGHAPVLILDDADIGKAVELGRIAKFRNAGQVCNVATRFYVQRNVHGDFVDAFSSAASGIVVGDGRAEDTQMGPLANPRRVTAMERLVADARERGGRVSGGGRIGDRGNFYAPTVIDGASADAVAYHEEPFGPLALVSAFDTIEEGLALANASTVGLGSFVFTRDGRRQRQVIDGLDAGLVGVNSFIVSFPETPFGGVKDSGNGHEGGSEGIEPYLVRKFVHVG